MENQRNWQDEPITEKQILAIKNKLKGFKISINTMPKTKGEAKLVFEKLNSIIAQKGFGLDFASNDSTDNDHWTDYVDPIF